MFAQKRIMLITAVLRIEGKVIAAVPLMNDRLVYPERLRAELIEQHWEIIDQSNSAPEFFIENVPSALNQERKRWNS